MGSNRVTLDQPVVTTRDGRTIIRIPMQIRRMSGRKQIIVPKNLDGSGPDRSAVQKPLAIAVARGHRWRDLLESGKHSSVTAIANEVGVDLSYVRRHIRLTCLSPRLVESILDGDEPNGLSLERLFKELPAAWVEQTNIFRECGKH